MTTKSDICYLVWVLDEDENLDVEAVCLTYADAETFITTLGNRKAKYQIVEKEFYKP